VYERRGIGAAKFSAVNRVRMSVPTSPGQQSEQGRRIPEAGVGKMGALPNVQCISSCNALGARHQGHAHCVIWELWVLSVMEAVQCQRPGASLCAT
jgi:hypothetical protein